jgi:hypothetical protein
MKKFTGFTAALGLSLIAFVGCADQASNIEDPEGDSLQESLDGTKADAISARADSVETARVMHVVNTFKPADLKSLGLSSTVVSNIVAARTAGRIETLSGLSKIKGFGTTVYAAVLKGANSKKILKDAIRIPLLDSECKTSLATLSGQAHSAGLSGFGKYVWLDGSVSYSDLTNAIGARLQKLDIKNHTQFDSVCRFGTVESYNAAGLTVCYVGDGSKIANIVAGSVDDLVSDQYIMAASRFGPTKFLDRDVVESELPAAWQNYKPSFKNVLIINSTDDDGNLTGVDNIFPCN